MPNIRFCRPMPVLVTGLVVLVLSTAAPTAAVAQPLSRNVQLGTPAPSVAHQTSALMGGGRRVAIVRSQQTIEQVPDADRLVEDAVHQWEMLLLGLRIPYEIIDDSGLERRIPDRIQVLILPAVESLSDRQRDRILDYMETGRGLIASGRTGFYDEKGVRRGSGFMERAFHLKHVESLPPQRHGTVQMLNGNLPITQGIAPGFHLNIGAQSQLSAAMPTTGRVLGSIRTHDPSDQASFAGATFIVSSNTESSRFLWLRFQPQDVSRDARQQENYQRLVVNALAVLSRSATVSIENWPSARPMALTITGLPSPGFDPLNYYRNVSQFVGFTAERNLPVSYFLASGELSLFPSLYQSILDAGAEVGLSADNDALLVSDSLQTQIDRLTAARVGLGLKRVHGVYPPGGFLSPNTIRAIDETRAAYVLSSDVSALAPDRLDWWRYADYDESRIPEPVESDSIDHLAFLMTAPERLAGQQDPRQPQLATIPLIEDGFAAPGQTFEHVLLAGGYYAVPFYPELYRPYAPETSALKRVLDEAEAANAWFATASDVLLWWRQRAGIRMEIVSYRDNEMHIDLEKASTDTLKQIVLSLYLPGVRQDTVRIVELGQVSSRDPGTERIQVRLEPLVSRRTRIVVRWDR